MIKQKLKISPLPRLTHITQGIMPANLDVEEDSLSIDSDTTRLATECVDAQEVRRKGRNDEGQKSSSQNSRGSTELLPSSPATKTLDLLETQLSQDSCMLTHDHMNDDDDESLKINDSVLEDTTAAAKNDDPWSTKASRHSKFGGQFEVLNVMFENRELGIDVIELSVILDEKQPQSPPLICDGAAVVKEVYNSAKSTGLVSMQAGDVLCQKDHANDDEEEFVLRYRILTFSEFETLAGNSRRPLNICVRRYDSLPNDIFGEGGGNANHNKAAANNGKKIKQTMCLSMQSKNTVRSNPLPAASSSAAAADVSNMVTTAKGAVRREVSVSLNKKTHHQATNKIAAGVKKSINVENEKFGVVCQSCSAPKSNKRTAHHALCSRSRYFDGQIRDMCFSSASTGNCAGCKAWLLKDKSKVSHDTNCATKRYKEKARTHARRQNTNFGVICGGCSETDLFKSNVVHHTLCTRNSKFDINIRELCREGASVGCTACKERLENDFTRKSHGRNCRQSKSYQQNNRDKSSASIVRDDVTAPKSEYEMNRIRNIERNNKRLRELGLITEQEERISNSNARGEQQSRVVSNKNRKKEKIDGLAVGCEACLHKFRTGTAGNFRHHINCPESRRGKTTKRQQHYQTQQQHSPLQSPIFVSPPPPELPTNHKSHWEACGNPWGDDGHSDGDRVVLNVDENEEEAGNISQIQFNTPICGIPNDRYAIYPMREDSPYLETHCSDSDVGYSVLVLRRDRFALRPWGFTVALHEFGGACIVRSISPCSPAEAALDIGGRRTSQIVATSEVMPIGRVNSGGLRLNDIIICANGTVVGGMSESELAVVIDTSGPQLILVVARCKDQQQQWERINTLSEMERRNWYNVGYGLDWSVIGDSNPALEKASALVDRKRIGCDQTSSIVANKRERRCSGEKHENSAMPVSLATVPKEKAVEKYEKSILPVSLTPISEEISIDMSQPEGDESEGMISLQVDRKNGRSSETQMSKTEYSIAYTVDPRLADLEYDNDDLRPWLEEEAPWNGCVCGETHPRPIVVFWIECDKCKAWYNVSPKCVGFDEEKAANMNVWNCWECKPPAAMNLNYAQSFTKEDKQQRGNPEKMDLQMPSTYSTPSKACIGVGTFVDVTKRTWAGINKPGGIGKVMATRITKTSTRSIRYYDIQYILGGKEMNVESTYVTPKDMNLNESPAEIASNRKRRLSVRQ